MQFASEQFNFEKALLIKKKIEILTQVENSQQVEFQNELNFDVWNYHITKDVFIIVLLEFRGGKLIEKKSFDYKNPFDNSSDKDKNFNEWIKNQLFSFLINFYKTIFEKINYIVIPSILLPYSSIQNKIALQEIIEESFFRQYNKKRKITFRSPTKGKNQNLLKLAKSNAIMDFHQKEKDILKNEQMEHIKKFLNLSFTPKTIESFDIANTGDNSIIAGMVYFKNGVEIKENYRLFNIRSTQQQNDFLAMEEAIYRRYKRLKIEKKDLPDIILIDGGKGQLSSAAKSLQKLGIHMKGRKNNNQSKKNSVCLISIAKKEEEIYVVNKSNPLKISLENHGLKFLITVRNETHRFVNKSHIHQRDKKVFKDI